MYNVYYYNVYYYNPRHYARILTILKKCQVNKEQLNLLSTVFGYLMTPSGISVRLYLYTRSHLYQTV